MHVPEVFFASSSKRFITTKVQSKYCDGANKALKCRSPFQQLYNPKVHNNDSDHETHQIHQMRVFLWQAPAIKTQLVWLSGVGRGGESDFH